MPLVQLPTSDGRYSVVSSRLRDLNVIEHPKADEVISNLKNVSLISHESSNHQIQISEDLYQILHMAVHKILKYLQSQRITRFLEDLVHYNIFPVKHQNSYFLAMPKQVVRSHDVNLYSPYLHKLDMELDSYFLHAIGVETVITLSHIQFVLQTMKQQYGEDPVHSEDLSIAMNATEALTKICNSHSSVSISGVIYLLNERKVFTDCSKLVVNDLKHIHSDYPKLPTGWHGV